MSVKALMERLQGYVGRPITVEAGYYDICTEEGHNPHGNRPSDGKNYCKEFSMTFIGFKKGHVIWEYLSEPPVADKDQPDINPTDSVSLDLLAVYGVTQDGRELSVPFVTQKNETNGLSYRVITKIRDQAEVLFEPKITFDPSREFFDYGF